MHFSQIHQLITNLCCIAWNRQQEAARVYVNSDKIEFMHFNYDVTISLPNGKPLKLDLFIYLGSNISSTEIDVNVHIGKAWTAIDKLSTI